jgi:glucokinase
MRSLGLDLGGTNIKLALLDGDRPAELSEAPTLSYDGGPEAVLARMVELARSAGHVDSIGVALPGLFDRDGHALLLPNLYGDWRGRAISGPLSAALEHDVQLINDGHAFALAESRLGAGRGANDVMCIVCGTGIGGGLVLGGRLHLGPEQRAGEFGHHTVSEDGPVCECGNRGCLELYAGARAIARAASAEVFDEAVAHARDGDVRALQALERAGDLIGLAIANVLIFLCPERVVIGGGVVQAGELLLGPLRSSIAARARVAPLERIAIAEAELGPHAGAIGAALWGAEEQPSS